MKFDFSKSGQPDLQNKFQYIYSRLDMLAKIVRYNNELLLDIQKHIQTDFSLQKDVDDFYNTSPTGPPELEDK